MPAGDGADRPGTAPPGAGLLSPDPALSPAPPIPPPHANPHGTPQNSSPPLLCSWKGSQLLVALLPVILIAVRCLRRPVVCPRREANGLRDNHTPVPARTPTTHLRIVAGSDSISFLS